jgi:putative serine protease PepD
LITMNDKPNYYYPPEDAARMAESHESPAAPAETTSSGSEIPASLRRRDRSRMVPVVAALAVGAVIGGASGAGAALLVSGNRGGASISGTNETQGITVNRPDSVTAVTAVAAAVSPSVVTISVTDSSGSGGTGSGVVLSEDGYILTNNHVVTLDGAASKPEIQVRDNNGHLFTATIVGTDPTVDMAVIKLDNASGMTPIAWADSAKLNVGDVTIAMGAPLGLAGTVTTGIISALNRSIQIASSAAPQDNSGTAPDSSSPFDFFNFDMGQGQSGSGGATATATINIPVIQTDAAINPGNSGGALLDASGKLIGINVAIANAGSSSGQSGSIGVGFALPSNLAKRVSSEIIASGKATHGLLGAKVSDAASAKGSTTVGGRLEEVVGGGAAEKAGLKAGDVVLKFNGFPVTDASDLTALVRTSAAEETVTVQILRDGKTQDVTVTLGTYSG